MSDEFDEDGGDPDGFWGGYNGTGTGPGHYSSHWDDAAERDKLLGALAEAMSNKDSAATKQLIKDLVDIHGHDTNIDAPLQAALRNFRDWGEKTALFDTCREVTDWARRDDGPKETAMGIILELAKSMAEKNVKRAEDGLTSVLCEAPENSPCRKAATDALFTLAESIRDRDPDASRNILNAIARNADDGSDDKNRAIDRLIALAESCRESNDEVALDAVRDALWEMPDGDPRQQKTEDLREQLDGAPGKQRAENYVDQARPLSPDDFRQRFG